ncbi:phage tail protein [Vibrio cholerae]|uniref:phage major tropism determinant n=1 Tax=Vibrio cholerae TaxID=666 RepID=UPI0020884004|nr:phage tail protein [Vibrio cholerae]GIA23944.1 Phage tail fiber [Vibrio cholerae]
MSIPESALNYGSILTLAGENAEINGKLNSKPINFTHIAIGDANDVYVQPSRTQTALVHELARIPITGMEKITPSKPDAVPQLKVWAKIPDDIVDIAVREFAAVATFDGASYLHAVGNTVRIPILSGSNNGGEVNDIYIEMTFAVTSLDPIVMIDPTIVTATRKFVKDEDAKHLAAANPHPQYALASLVRSLSANTFHKSQTSEPAFFIAGGQLRTASAMTIRVGEALVTHAANEAISTPVLLVGVDYAIYATIDGLIVSNNFTVPDGYTEETSRRIGGFHYGDDEFKTHSFYDLHFRPKCKDPRGTVLDMGERFWADIYLTNTTPNLLGTSAYNAQIADGGSPPKIPAQLGGNGVQQYANYSQFAANELLACHGKRLPNYQEFQMLARGSVSGYVRGSDPVKTLFDSSARSIIGCEQVSGNMWQWGGEVWDRGDGKNGYTWHDIAEGYGQMHAAHSEGAGASLFGGYWDDSGRAGSRASHWNNRPASSAGSVGSRGVCDHFQQH